MLLHATSVTQLPSRKASSEQADMHWAANHATAFAHGKPSGHPARSLPSTSAPALHSDARP